jgi:hypothetical protein
MTTEAKIHKLEKILEDAHQEIALLKEEIKKQEATKFPMIGDSYWYISGNGGIVNDRWDKTITDQDRLSLGNVFPNAAAARARIEWLKVDTKYRRKVKELLLSEGKYIERTYTILLKNNYTPFVTAIVAGYHPQSYLVHGEAAGDKLLEHLTAEEWRTWFKG